MAGVRYDLKKAIGREAFLSSLAAICRSLSRIQLDNGTPAKSAAFLNASFSVFPSLTKYVSLRT